jgi:uncharacterized protein (UPF0335 family)
MSEEILPKACDTRPVFAEQDENGVDLSLIRELLKLTPLDRLRRMDRATTDAIRLRKYAREQR